MLILASIAAALTVQTSPPPPAPPPPPEVRRDVRIMTMGGPGEPGGMDKDGDGFVSRDEFNAPMADAFAHLDADGDGRISTDELHAGGPGERDLEWRAGPAGGPPGSGGDRQVFVITSDGDGPGGMHVIAPGDPEGPGGPHERYEIRRFGGPDGPGDMDKDGDGKVTQDEFLAPMRDAFQRMDADHSGTLEAAERGGDRQVRVITREETRTED